MRVGLWLGRPKSRCVVAMFSVALLGGALASGQQPVHALVNACIEGTDYARQTTGDDVLVTFVNTSASCDFTMPVGSTVDYLVVGGGGGGGGGSLYYSIAHCTNSGSDTTAKPGGGGAGGGGGVVVSGTLTAAKDDILTVQVGSGGVGGLAGGCPVLYVSGVQLTPEQQANYTSDGSGGSGGAGAASSVALNTGTPITAAGGTGGGGGSAQGRAGTSGGTSGTKVGGSLTATTTDCAYNAVDGCWSAPGGAGAGADGSGPAPFSNTCKILGADTSITDANGGNGGAGVTWPVTSVAYGGGGGGGIRHPATNPGNCPLAIPAGVDRTPGTATDGGGNGYLGNGVAGTDGKGGGGGGGRGNGAANNAQSNAGLGGKGGRGAVIIRYSTAAPTTPGAPADVQVRNLNKKVQLSWSAPTAVGSGPVTGYAVEFTTVNPSVAGVSDWKPGYRNCALALTGISTATTCDLTGLTNGTTYWFRVSALNIAGQGPPSVAARYGQPRHPSR